MKKNPILVAIAAILVLSAFAFPLLAPWKVAENYAVKFKSKSFDGSFSGLKADIQFDEAQLATSKISASIDATSIKTGNGMRDRHAQQGLDAAKYPQISFVSSAIVKTNTGYEATGKLTIKNVTKEIKLPFTFEPTASGGLFVGKFSVVPEEYQVTKWGTPSQVDIELSVPVLKN